MSKKTLQNSVDENKIEACGSMLTNEFLQIVRTLKFTLIFTVRLLLLGMMLGFSNNAHSINSRCNTISTEQPLTKPLSVNSEIMTYADKFYEANDKFALKATGYELGYSGVISQTCIYSWTAQISGTTALFNSISAVSDLIGWAAGDGPTVRRTIDGTTWTNATGTGINGDVYAIFASDANIAFCTTTPLFGSTPSFIYRTSNGGSTWTQVHATAVNGFIDAIQMISSSEGYALGDPLNSVWTVLRTTNGGINWAQMPSAPGQVGAEVGSNNSFFILGNDIWFGTSATKVYHSTNLGLTWTSGSTTGTTNSYAVHYNDAVTGLTGGSAMLLSTNGGTTYSSVASPGVTGRINGIEGAGTDWWATRSGSIVYHSTNQGNSWTSVYNLSSAVFNDIDFTDAAGCPTGWAVGNSGVIVKMSTMTGISNYNSEVPSSYSLKQNFPNPFNPTTNVIFSIPKSGLVKLKVYDMVGKEVATLVNEVKSTGNYIVGFNASNLPSGAYFYRIKSNNFVDTKKMLLIK